MKPIMMMLTMMMIIMMRLLFLALLSAMASVGLQQAVWLYENLRLVFVYFHFLEAIKTHEFLLNIIKINAKTTAFLFWDFISLLLLFLLSLFCVNESVCLSVRRPSEFAFLKLRKSTLCSTSSVSSIWPFL